jgi:hypothetical protein
MLATPELKIVLKDYELAPIPIRMVQAAQARPPLTLGSFIDFSAPRLRKSLARGA